jgi:transcriptional regulator with XRE-family HTH domain
MNYRDRRERGGWTLEEIARLAEVNVSTLYRIERGVSKPNRATVRAIEAALAIKESEPKTEAAS